MKKYLSIILIIFLFACSNDDDSSSRPGGSNTTPNGTQGNCRISKEVLIVNGDSANQETIEYFYSNNLLVKKRFGGNFGFYDSTMFLYNSMNQLKYVLESDFFSQIPDTSYMFNYDNLGNVIKIIEIEGNTVDSEFNLTYDETRLSGFFADYKNFGTEKYVVKSNLNGNILEMELIEVDGQATPDELKILLTYDNKVNPYKGIYDNELILWSMFSSNNTLDIRAIENGSSIFSSTSTYTYNSNGYPSKISTLEDGDTYTRFIEYLCN